MTSKTLASLVVALLLSNPAPVRAQGKTEWIHCWSEIQREEGGVTVARRYIKPPITITDTDRAGWTEKQMTAEYENAFRKAATAVGEVPGPSDRGSVWCSVYNY